MLPEAKQKNKLSRIQSWQGPIAVSRRIVKVHNEDAWRVESETTDYKFYKVTEAGECDCPDFQRRGLICKHIWALIRREIA